MTFQKVFHWNGLTIEIKVKGCDKQLVGEVAAQIMSYRPAKKDPYKQKRD